MRKHLTFRGRVTLTMLLFFAAVFSLPASRNGDARLWLLAAAVPAVMVLLLLFPSRVLFLDRPSLAAAMALCGFGIMAAAFHAPESALSRALYCAGALFFLLVGLILVRAFRLSLLPAAFMALLALGLISCPLWLNGTFSLNGIGLALLLVAVSAFLSLRLYLPALTAVLSGILLILLQQRSEAVIWAVLCVLLFWTSSGSGIWSCVAFLAVGSLLTVFFAIASPFSPDGSVSMLQALGAMPLIPPETPLDTGAASDAVYMLLGDQFGVCFLFFALFLLCSLLVRGSSLALGARSAFHASLALGIVLYFGLRTLAFLLFMADILPDASCGLPFLSGPPQDLCAEFLLLGCLSGIAARNEADLEEDARLSMLAR